MICSLNPMATKNIPEMLKTQNKYGANRGVKPLIQVKYMVRTRAIWATMLNIIIGISMPLNEVS